MDAIPAQRAAARLRQTRSAPASRPTINKNGADRIEGAARAAVGANRKFGLELKPSQCRNKFVNFTCRWLASKRQQLCDQVPVFGGEMASVGVWPIDPDGLNGNVCATFNLYEVERN